MTYSSSIPTIDGTPVTAIVAHAIRQGWVKPNAKPMTDAQICTFRQNHRKGSWVLTTPKGKR